MANLLNLALVFSISLIIGCSSKNIRTPNQPENCSIEPGRTPSSLCRNSYTNRTPLSLEITKKIDDAFETLRLEHDFNPEVYVDSNVGSSAVTHYKLVSKNRKLFETYLNAGVIVSTYEYLGAKEFILKPPKDIRDLFKNLIGHILSVEPDLSKAVLPALLFQRGGEFKLSRPGFDALPSKSEGWQLVTTSIQLQNHLFERSYAEGKLALTVDPGFLFHDVSHLIDGAYQPNLMRLLRVFFGKIAGGDKDLSLDLSTPDIGNYVNEFLITANTNNVPLIESLILDRTNMPEAQKRVQLQSEIRDKRFWNRLERIDKDIFKILEIHGGAALDGYNLIANSSRYLRETVYSYAMGENVSKGDGFQSYLAHDSFWGLIQQMLIMKAVLTQNFEGFSEYKTPVRPNLKRLSEQTDETTKHRLESALVDLFIELETRMGTALKYQISSEKIIEDLMSPDFQQTKTYLFFKSAARPGGLEEHLFVKP
jgi:hypothetical protein